MKTDWSALINENALRSERSTNVSQRKLFKWLWLGFSEWRIRLFIHCALSQVRVMREHVERRDQFFIPTTPTYDSVISITSGLIRSTTTVTMSQKEGQVPNSIQQPEITLRSATYFNTKNERISQYWETNCGICFIAESRTYNASFNVGFIIRSLKN